MHIATKTLQCLVDRLDEASDEQFSSDTHGHADPQQLEEAVLVRHGTVEVCTVCMLTRLSPGSLREVERGLLCAGTPCQLDGRYSAFSSLEQETCVC